MPIALPVETLTRVPMSREEFLDLPEDVRAEWADGVATLMPPSKDPQLDAAGELFVVLRTALPGFRVRWERGVKIPTGALRMPDLVVQRLREDAAWSDETPLLAVEVLSRSTRRVDLGPKMQEYLQAGISHYWLLDPADRTLIVLRHADDRWETLAQFDDEHPTGEIAVGEHGVVPIDLGVLLGSD